MSESRVSVIISCFNEEATIAECIQSVHDALPEAEILVVDGGHDRTFDIASEFCRDIPRLVVFRNENDKGKGHAIREGCRRATGEVIAQFDSDLQFYARDLPALVDPILRGEADVCVGSRFLGAADHAAYKPMFFRDLGNRLLSGLVSGLTGQTVTDVTTGMKAWSREAGATIAFTDDRYSYEAEIVVKAIRSGLRLIEVPVSFASRKHGQSMHRTTLALMMAGAVIGWKVLRWRITTPRRPHRSGRR